MKFNLLMLIAIASGWIFGTLAYHLIPIVSSGYWELGGWNGR